MKSLVLIGFMGTGKTAVGRELARRLQWPFLDTDDLISESAGKSITRLFAEDGEAAFRARESRVLEGLAAAEPARRVVATGGGAVLAESNWDALRRLGAVVALTAGIPEILSRVRDAAERPLLAGTPEEVAARVGALLEARRGAYARADLTVATDGLTPAEVAEKILAWSRDVR